mmetsp:Transcript_109488/g.320459  ORF Transcript_109488/g.320459 Transcript_109488/m.320459 type:complete len:262 (-) Transcript_109488:687-1472(-)
MPCASASSSRQSAVACNGNLWGRVSRRKERGCRTATEIKSGDMTSLLRGSSTTKSASPSSWPATSSTALPLSSSSAASLPPTAVPPAARSSICKCSLGRLKIKGKRPSGGKATNAGPPTVPDAGGSVGATKSSGSNTVKRREVFSLGAPGHWTSTEISTEFPEGKSSAAPAAKRSTAIVPSELAGDTEIQCSLAFHLNTHPCSWPRPSRAAPVGAVNNGRLSGRPWPMRSAARRNGSGAPRTNANCLVSSVLNAGVPNWTS